MTIPIIRSAEDVFATSLLRFCRLIRLVRIVKVFRLKAMKDWAVDQVWLGSPLEMCIEMGNIIEL